MSNAGQSEFRPGLEGVVAFRTEIAEPDRDGGALRYRGVDIEDLAGRVSFGDVWQLLVDGEFGRGLPATGPALLPVRTGNVRVDAQAAIAMLGPAYGFEPLLDITDEQARDQLARTSTLGLSYVAQSARGDDVPSVPEHRIDQCSTLTERFLTRWRGEPDPAHVQALDAYWVSAAEHGMNASTFTARVIASTGADVAAGTAVRFEPGVEREVDLVPIGGARVVRGLRKEYAGRLDERGSAPGTTDYGEKGQQ